MIEQKGPGLPQAACRHLSSSIYLQACAPALPPVWQACPGPSSLPSSLHLSPALSTLPPRLLCSVHWFLFLCLCAYDLYLWVFSFFFTPKLCVCVVAVSICVCAWLWMLLALCCTCSPLRKWCHSVAYSLKDRTRRAWHKSFRSGF